MTDLQSQLARIELRIMEDTAADEENHEEEMAALTKANSQLKRQIEGIKSTKDTFRNNELY